jgi:hypothetical protein
LGRLRARIDVEKGLIGAEDLAAEEAEFDRDIGLDQALAQFRAGLDEIKAICETSGCEAHYREAEDLERGADEVGNQIRNTKPVTLAGAIAMLEWGREGECDEHLNGVIAGLRDMQPVASRISSGDEPILTAAEREELPEILAEMGYDRAARTWVRNGAADRDQKVIGFGEPEARR